MAVRMHVCVCVCVCVCVSAESCPGGGENTGARRCGPGRRHMEGYGETEHLARKVGRGEWGQERKRKPGQDEGSGATSGAPRPKSLLSPSCFGSSDSFKGEKALSLPSLGKGLPEPCPGG